MGCCDSWGGSTKVRLGRCSEPVSVYRFARNVNSAGSAHKPPARRGVGLEKVQQQLRHFSLPRRRLVRTVGGGEVTLLVAEAVGPLRAAVRPQIGTPAQ